MSERKYPHPEITEYQTELFLEAFQVIFHDKTNEILVSTNNTTRKEVREFLIKSLMTYLGVEMKE